MTILTRAPSRLFGPACLAAAAAFFSLGTLVYLGCRPQQPILFTALGIDRASFLGDCPGMPFAGSLPTFAHVTAFALGSCALLPPGMRSALLAAGFWTAANLVWELYHASGVTALDLSDVQAAFLGFAVAVGMAAAFQRLPANQSSPA